MPIRNVNFHLFKFTVCGSVVMSDDLLIFDFRRSGVLMAILRFMQGMRLYVFL